MFIYLYFLKQHIAESYTAEEEQLSKSSNEIHNRHHKYAAAQPQQKTPP